MIQIIDKNDYLILTVQVIPRASKSEIVGELSGKLKVRISAPPIDDAANAQLIVVLAKHLKIPKSNVEIIGGQTSRTKRIKISGAAAEQIQNLV